MAENNLNNDPNVSNFLSSLNAVFSALRGTFAPRNNAGDVGDGAADLGSSTNNWDRAYIKRLIAGGNLVDIASLAVSAATYIFDATDASFSWPGSQTKCLAFVQSGTGRTPNGGATTVTIGGTTASSGVASNGLPNNRYHAFTGISQGDTLGIQIGGAGTLAAGSLPAASGFVILYAF